MSLERAEELVIADQRSGDEDGMSNEELLDWADNTVSLTPAPGASEFEDHGDEISQAYLVFLHHRESQRRP